MINQVISKTEREMEKVLQETKQDFATIRTGRAKPSLVEGITANYYGTATPINQMAKISAPEPRQLLIQPWDNNVLEDIEKAILTSDLDLNPNNDGEVIRINIPQLTEERRKELVQLAGQKAEDNRILIRNLRRDANSELEELEAAGDISEDNYHRALDEVQELTDQYIQKIDDLLAKKENDILEI
ncbi:ribosome recycling factor [Fuchsiella alkaliacetigena]|uniref:ribosome recycling factor n=1 Tax=Fuchsiella alkaliacetigena TaxID=957042 RepID=UPI00200B8184|nr:ribosome recycling factor [Fuchsiella alkaliacetigena]MCK8823518.1 ribosome recycling factor [Fuchsiella alkaliacetigena]